MWQFRESRDLISEGDGLTFAVGAIGGFAIGVFISGRAARVGRIAGQGARRVGERARTVSDRLRPARRRPPEEGESRESTRMEDAVLDIFLADPVLGERGIDVGVIGRGIVELSGSVYTEEEADRAVAVARRVDGVHTVVNRMEIEMESQHQSEVRRRSEEGDSSLAETEHNGMTGGMGVRRQARETDPARPDDSQHHRERALEDADRDQWENEGYTKRPRVAARPEDERAESEPDFAEDELDNQDPHGKHARVTLDEPPQHGSPTSRVGEPPKPGVELELERAGLDLRDAADRE